MSDRITEIEKRLSEATDKWWRPSRTDDEWVQRIRDEYPDDCEEMTDDWVIDKYADGWEFADTWDHLGDAREDYAELAPAYLQMESDVRHLLTALTEARAQGAAEERERLISDAETQGRAKPLGQAEVIATHAAQWLRSLTEGEG